jgi:hypothetical protein
MRPGCAASDIGHIYGKELEHSVRPTTLSRDHAIFTSYTRAIPQTRRLGKSRQREVKQRTKTGQSILTGCRSGSSSVIHIYRVLLILTCLLHTGRTYGPSAATSCEFPCVLFSAVPWILAHTARGAHGPGRAQVAVSLDWLRIKKSRKNASITSNELSRKHILLMRIRPHT